MGELNIVELLAWSGFVNGIFALGTGLFVLWTDWRNRANQFLSLFTLALVVWSLSYSRWLAIDAIHTSLYTGAAELFWTRLTECAALWIPITYLQWLVVFFKFDLNKEKHIKYILIMDWALTAVIAVLGFTPLYISGVRPEIFFRFWPTAGILFDVFTVVLYCGVGFVYAPLLMYQKIRQARKEAPEEVRGLVLFLVGLMASTVAGFTNFPLFYGIPLPPFGNFLVSFWVFFTAYITIRYNTLHLKKVVATEMLVIAIWIFLLSRIFITIIGGSLIGAIPDAIVLFGSVLIGVFLIRSVLNEVKQKEELERVNSELDKSNQSLKSLSQHLQDKVDEQTKDVRQAYEVEHKAKLELEELDKNKDQFILATQHHLRTPLTIIKGYIQSLLQKPPQDFKAETRETLQNLDSNADKLSSLVNELLDVSEMEVRKSIPGGDALPKR